MHIHAGEGIILLEVVHFLTKYSPTLVGNIPIKGVVFELLELYKFAYSSK